MQKTPFHVYYTARNLSNLAQKEKLIPVFASSNIEVYPFQVAAANFALRSHYRKGVILCDEAGLGKTHEAMLVVVQRWMEGLNRILIAVPNVDLLVKWRETFEKYYTVPYKVLINRDEIDKQIVTESTNAFEQDAVILTTYDFLVDYQVAAKKIDWDITVFDEANLLSSVCDEKGKEAKILKEIAEPSYKILLTGTPIEKNIMDLYGLMYFIDETVLPDAETYMRRYLRRPENYPELAERVSKYCFRTLRSQAKRYAKLPERILVTLEYTPSAKERRLYDLLYNYCNKENKVAFPKMDSYEMSLKLLSLQSSSTAAVYQTIKKIIKRLEHIPDSSEEINELKQMQTLAESIETDEKAKLLIRFLNMVFPSVRLTGAAKKAVIFTEYIETQKVLYGLLKERYKVSVYNGSADYSALKDFKENGNILISTDIGARGFDLTEASLIINYDLLFNSLKMEQRIDRCQRLGQQNDVLAVAFIDKNNYSDVRKLELIRKRYVVSEGVFGLSDPVIGGFTNDLNEAVALFAEKARLKEQIQKDYISSLNENKEENEQTVESAENILFTTFTKEIADKIKITPKYVEEKSKELKPKLWEIVKLFFERYNAENDDCFFEIDDKEQIITATKYDRLPHLFYYPVNGKNKPYKSLKKYGMSSDFRPHQGRITFSTPLVRGILHNYECPIEGTINVDANIEPCTIALYEIEVTPSKSSYLVFAGQTASGRLLIDEECKQIFSLPIINYTESGDHKSHWIKGFIYDNSYSQYPILDRQINREEFAKREREKLSDEQKAEIDRMKLNSERKKINFSKNIELLEKRFEQINHEEPAFQDRLSQIKHQKQNNLIYQKFMQQKEKLFFNKMQIDAQLEKDIDEFLKKERVTVYVKREFVIKAEGIKNG